MLGCRLALACLELDTAGLVLEEAEVLAYKSVLEAQACKLASVAVVWAYMLASGALVAGSSVA